MRLFLAIVWAGAIFALTCASDSGFWQKNEAPRFHWTKAPDYSELTLFKPEIGNKQWMLRKVGHFVSFGALAVLLVLGSGSRRAGFAVAVSYAVLTELLQLHFHRDGRLFDIAIDTAGIACFLMLGPGRRRKLESGGTRRADAKLQQS